MKQIGNITAGVVAIAAAALIAPAANAAPQPSHQYPAALAVRENVPEGDHLHRITGETSTGILYAWIMEDADIIPGDLVAAIMDDAGTPDNVTDDAVIDIRYCGPSAW